MNRDQMIAHLTLLGWVPQGTADWCGLGRADVGVFIFISDMHPVVRKYTNTDQYVERTWESISNSQLMLFLAYIKQEGL